MDIYIYIGLALLAVVIVIGMFIRKGIYREVDTLEQKKDQVKNQSIPEEIGKLKKLKMSGETEERFESWRSDWDEVVSAILPEIEERLFDIEDLANKYRFKKANEVVKETNERLTEINDQLDMMVQEIDELVSSEEKNRLEISEVEVQFRQLQSELLKKRGSFGEAIQALDKQMDEIKEKLTQFNSVTKEGNYLQARKILNQVKEELAEQKVHVEQIPKILVQLKTTIPAECRNLRAGIKEMEEEGYYLEPLSFETRIEHILKGLTELHTRTIALEEDQITEDLKQYTDEIEQMYEQLEKEVDAKKIVQDVLPHLRKELTIMDNKMLDLNKEIAHVQLSYRMSSEELLIQDTIKNQVTELTKQLQVIVDVIENERQTFSSIGEMIKQWEQELKELEKEILLVKEKLDTLREDELKAKETVQELRKVILDNKRQIRKSNIPGLPQQSLQKLESGEQLLNQAIEQLNVVPLEMEGITALIEEAIEIVEQNKEMVAETIELAQLAEQLIQHSNRYRHRSEEAYEELMRAEQFFREFEYEEAIECVVRAVEPYDAQILERIKNNEIA